MGSDDDTRTRRHIVYSCLFSFRGWSTDIQGLVITRCRLCRPKPCLISQKHPDMCTLEKKLPTRRAQTEVANSLDSIAKEEAGNFGSRMACSTNGNSKKAFSNKEEHF